MTCPSCARPNRVDRQFCVHCGARLDRPEAVADGASARPRAFADEMLRPASGEGDPHGSLRPSGGIQAGPFGPAGSAARPAPSPNPRTDGRETLRARDPRDLSRAAVRDSGEFRLNRDSVRDAVRHAAADGKGADGRRAGNPWATQMMPAAPLDPDSVLMPGVASRPIAMLCKECGHVTRKKSPYCEKCGRPLPNLEGSVLLSSRWSGGRTPNGDPAIYAVCTVRPSVRFLSGTPPRNIGFLIDTSTLRPEARSDAGGLKMVRKFLDYVVDEMSPQDHLTVGFFGNRPYLLVGGERIEDKKAVKRLMQRKMEALDLGDGRFLNEGIEQVCREVRRNLSQEKVNRVIILTGGAIQDPEESLKTCQYESELGISFSTLTLSDGDYSHVLQDLARAGNGKCYPNVEFRHIPEILSQELMTVRATFTTQVELFVHVDPGWSVSRVFKISPVITDLGRSIAQSSTFSIKLSDLQLYDDQTLLLELVPVAADAQRTTIALAELVCDFPHDDVTNMNFHLPIKITSPRDAWAQEDPEVAGIVRMIMAVFGRNAPA